MSRPDFPPPALQRIPALRASTSGPEVAQVASLVGIDLDAHQRHAMDIGCSEKADGTWAATQVGFFEPRQNGKSRLLLARKVAGVLLYEEPLIIHSAHEVKSAMEQFGYLKELVDNYDVLRKRVKKLNGRTGSEGFEFYGTGATRLTKTSRINVLARTKGSGRGFSASTLILDEAMHLGFGVFAALLPTLSAVPNSQVWMAGTPPSPDMNGEVVTRARKQARDGTSPRLAWVEWGSSPDPSSPKDYDYSDPANWRKANPALVAGRIPIESVEDEFAAMDEETFRRDRLGEWDQDGGLTIVPQAVWSDQAAPKSFSVLDKVIAVDINPKRSRASVALAGWTSSEKRVRHVEVLAQGPGTDWVGPFLRTTLDDNPDIKAVVVDGGSPADTLSDALERVHRIRVTRTNTRQMASACGQMYDGFMGRVITHSGQEDLTAAMVGSVKRDLMDAWALSRKRAEVDISGFVAATLALYGVTLKKVRRPSVGRRGERKVYAAT